MKFKVTYSRKVYFEGTIEAADEDTARRMWDEGYTPVDEDEYRDDGEDFISLEPV